MSLSPSVISFRNQFFSSIDSTSMELIRQLNTSDLQEGVLIQAAFQAEGKGQGGNIWESEQGKNLLFSFLLKPRFLKISEQFYITIVVSLALADTVCKFVGNQEVKIKWPNDIYVGHQKIAGILIENSICGDQFDWVVVGVGLNVNQQSFRSDVPNPISLKLVLGSEIDLDQVLSIFENQLAQRYAQLQASEYKVLKAAYLKSLYQYGEWKNYKSGNREFSACIKGVDTYGFLRLETSEGERVFDVKELSYL